MAWTKEEIEKYVSIRRTELGPVYASQGLEIDKPEKRAEFLYKILNLTMTDEDTIRNNTSQNEKADSLRMLEDMAIKIFF
ncbi:MAG: hypothetical protein Q8P15_00735 [Nanoarchaeota archaeon]|nr:hypothetical protein [Nanoarchaeota archaeon]